MGAICITWSPRDLSGHKTAASSYFIIHIIHLWFSFSFQYQLLALSQWSHFQTFEERISNWSRQSTASLLYPGPLSSLLFVCLWIKGTFLLNSLWPKVVTLNEVTVQRIDPNCLLRASGLSTEVCPAPASLLCTVRVGVQWEPNAFFGRNFIYL